jgi:hypothetical protein
LTAVLVKDAGLISVLDERFCLITTLDKDTGLKVVLAAALG